MPDNPRDQQDAEKMVRMEAARGGPFVVAAESTLMPMLIADPTLPDIPIVFANAAFTRLSGYSREEILGKNYHLLSGSGTDPEVARAIGLALRAGEDIVRQVRLYRRDGKQLWVLQHVAPVFEEGRIRHHFVSFVDITERKAAEDELRQLNEELDHRVSVRTGRLDELNRQLAAEVERRTEVEHVLRNTLADKDVLLRDNDNLMKEVNHRVKNTLQMASSFLRIQSDLKHGREPAVQEALHSAVERLDRMAEIHETLYRTQGLQEIEFGGYLRMLCRDLLVSFEPAQSLRVVLDVDADEVFLKPDQAIPLALIANEAMINALKYAFPDGRSGRIAVSFREISYEVLRMSISDDGIGMSDDGIGMADERRTGSLGLTLMELLAEQVKGGLTVGSGAGTTVTVSIPA